MSGRLMLAALIDGERDPETLARLAQARMRSKIPALIEALTGNFGEHHAFLCRLHLDRIDQISAAIEHLSARITTELEPFQDRLTRLQTIPGIGQGVAEVIIAETGGDMSRFPSAGHLASWAGVCPGQHESAGRSKSRRTRHSNHWLTAALGVAVMVMGAARTKDTTLIGARYRRLVPRLGRQKALVAVQHTTLIAVWQVLSDRVEYRDLGGDYFTRRDPAAALRRITRQANALGYTVRLDHPISTTPITAA